MHSKGPSHVLALEHCGNLEVGSFDMEQTPRFWWWVLHSQFDMVLSTYSYKHVLFKAPLRAAVLWGDLDMASHCREYILKKHLRSDTWTSVLAGDQRSSSIGSGTVRNRGATPKCQHSCRTAEHKSLITEICSRRPPDSENRAAFDWPLPESGSVTCPPISDVRFTAHKELQDSTAAVWHQPARAWVCLWRWVSFP